MLIQVTQEHIDAGIKEDCMSCPVALAIESVCKDGVAVFMDTVHINKSIYLTPTSVAKFIDAFDTGKPVKPFTFELP